MAKTYIILGALISVLLAAAWIGCSDVEPNPVAPEPPFVDYDSLDLTMTTVGPSGSGLPWGVTQDWHINTTVTILPGTQIVFRDSVSVFVDTLGRIVAQGTEASPIEFTSARRHPEMGDWRSFKLNNPSLDERSVFEYCIITYGGLFPIDTTSDDAKYYRGVIACRNASPIVKHCVIANNQNNAVFMTGELCQPIVRYNIFWSNDASAVRCDNSVLLPEFYGQSGFLDISYNGVGENSAISFLMGSDTTRFGTDCRVNANRDTVDCFFNIDAAPLFRDDTPGFVLSSCSPCIDAGPVGEDGDVDGTRTDFGVISYEQEQFNLRGLVGGTLAAGETYQMSCHVKVDSGTTLTIPAGTTILVDPSDPYIIEVHGRLVIEGTPGNRVRIAGLEPTEKWGGIRFLGYDTVSAPSVLRYVDLVNYSQMDVYRGGVDFFGCRFDSCFEYGMYISTAGGALADTVSLRNCRFERTGLSAINSQASPVTVRNTLISDSRGRGISLTNVGTMAEISNCIVRGCATSALFMEDFCEPMVVNNVLADNLYYGIEAVNNCLPVVMNTIIYRNDIYGVYARQSSVPALSYNDVYGNVTDYWPSTLAHPNSLSADPLFVGDGDWRLAAGSPGINAGNPAPEYNDPDGSGNDMGAYGGPGSEYGVGTQTARPTRPSLVSK